MGALRWQVNDPLRFDLAYLSHVYVYLISIQATATSFQLERRACGYFVWTCVHAAARGPDTERGLSVH